MSKKNKNKIDLEESLEILLAYGFIPECPQFFQIRFYKEEEPDILFDWYHTTGSMVKTDKHTGCCYSMGSFMQAEEVAMAAKKNIEALVL